MKLTKFAQSCLLIETKGKRILIDPGTIQYDEKLLAHEWNDIDMLLVTHMHSDHCNEKAIQEIVKNPKTIFYTSNEVAKHYPQLSPKIVTDGDIMEMEDIKIEVVNAVHGYIPRLKEYGIIVYENIGYIIDDGEKRCYTTSDTICFDNNYKCDILCVPVCNHGLVMGPFEAAVFAKETMASLVIPIHYDNPTYPADMTALKKIWDEHNIPYKILGIGESVTI